MRHMVSLWNNAIWLDIWFEQRGLFPLPTQSSSGSSSTTGDNEYAHDEEKEFFRFRSCVYVENTSTTWYFTVSTVLLPTTSSIRRYVEEEVDLLRARTQTNRRSY